MAFWIWVKKKTGPRSSHFIRSEHELVISGYYKTFTSECVFTILLTNSSLRLHERRTLREKCSYTELFWSVFSRIRTEYGEISICRHSVRMRENTDQKISEYGHCSCSGIYDPMKHLWTDFFWEKMLKDLSR